MGFMDKVKKAAESAQAATSKVGIGASADQMASATGNTDTPGGTEYVISLTVKPAAGEPYQASTNQYIYPSAPFSEGQDVTVKVDPADSSQVMIFGGA